jgi:hypothetical protein
MGTKSRKDSSAAGAGEDDEDAEGGSEVRRDVEGRVPRLLLSTMGKGSG